MRALIQIKAPHTLRKISSGIRGNPSPGNLDKRGRQGDNHTYRFLNCL